MNQTSPAYPDPPLCRFLANLHREIEEVAACEARQARLCKPKNAGSPRRRTHRSEYR